MFVPGLVRADNNYERNVRTMPNFIDDEMTDADWEEYSRDFERRYNEHYESVRRSSRRRVYDDYYDDGDAWEQNCEIDSLLPTAEDIERHARLAGIDTSHNRRCMLESFCRVGEGTMAEFFLESQF